MEGALKQRAELGYTEPTLQQMAGATTVAVRRLRAMLGAAGMANGAARMVRRLPRRRINVGEAIDFD
jgi:hypothetical protein